MSTCPNCQTQIHGNICPLCGYRIENPSLTTPSSSPKRKGKIPAILRLSLIAIFAMIGIVILIAGAFRQTDMTALDKLTDLIASSGIVFFFGAWIWGLIKWSVFAIPRTFKAAKAVITHIIPLTWFALVAEIMFGIWLVFIPISLYSLPLTPVMTLFMKFLPSNFVLSFILFAVSILLLILIARIEYRKISTAKQSV